MTDLLREIVKQHGGELYAGATRATIPGPGHSKKDRSLSLRLVRCGDSDRVIWHSFADDAPRDVMRHLGLSAAEVRQATREERANWRRQREEEERRQRKADQQLCQEIWAGTMPLEGSPAETYLWHRGLIIDGCPDLRFHPAAPRTKDRDKGVPPCPAMVAVVRDRDGASMSVHLTYIKADGSGKAFGDKSRLMFGPMRGGAVHLAPSGPVLGVGEGIETCAAYRALKGVPTWAALTTSQYATFQLPRDVRKLVIAADGDRGGLTAAQSLAERMQRLCDVEIDPAPAGKDWADVWVARDV